MIGCFLCGNDRAVRSPGWEPNEQEGIVRLVECPCCGRYKISVPAETEITHGIHKKDVFPIIAGLVFDSWYYQKEVKIILAEDFRTAKPITTAEKLYRLEKYFYTEAQRAGNEDISQRPACCGEAYTQRYADLMEALRDYGIIAYILACDDSEGYESFFLDIRMTVKARIAFEKGINTAEDFERVFMNKDKQGMTVEGDVIRLNDGSLLVKASGHAVVTATQNNGLTMVELQPLIDRLLAAVPPDTPKEANDKIKESVEAIQAEVQSPMPKKGMIKTILAGLSGVIKAAEFTAALNSLTKFFGG